MIVRLHSAELERDPALPASIDLPQPPPTGLEVHRNGARWTVERVLLSIDGWPACDAWLRRVPDATAGVQIAAPAAEPAVEVEIPCRVRAIATEGPPSILLELGPDGAQWIGWIGVSAEDVQRVAAGTLRARCVATIGGPAHA